MYYENWGRRALMLKYIIERNVAGTSSEAKHRETKTYL